MPRDYTIGEARTALATIRPVIDELIVVRADAVELNAAVNQGFPSPLGGLPELKAAEARFDELLTSLAALDIQIKGVAPLLLDFPSTLDGVPVLLCWVEGEPDIRWYHRLDLGFAGRRPLPQEL